MTAPSPSEQVYQTLHFEDDRGPLVVQTSIALTTIIVVVVTLRTLSRWLLHLPSGWDDLFCICAMILIILMCAINIVSVHYGMGRHIWATDPAQGYKIIQAGFYLAIDYCLTHFAIKMSLLFTYNRFFGRFNRKFNYAVWFIMFYVTSWTISGIVATLTQCSPPSYFWNQYNIDRDPPAEGHCPVISVPLVVSNSALNLAADFMLLLLPLPMLWKLQMPLGRKIGLIPLFLFGIFSCVAGILRLTATLNSVSVNSDSTWNLAIICFWTIFEGAVQLFCACILIVWPLFIKLSKKVSSSLGRSSQASSRQYLPGGSSDRRSDAETQAGSAVKENSIGLSTLESEYNYAIKAEPSPNDTIERLDGHIVKHIGYSVEVHDRSLGVRSV